MWSLCAKLTDSLPTSRLEGWSDVDDNDVLLDQILSEDDGDIYIMMQCLSQKIITSELSAGGANRDAC